MTCEMIEIPLEKYNEIVNDTIRESIEEKKKILSADVLEKIKSLEELRSECGKWIEEVKKEKSDYYKPLKDLISSVLSTCEMINREIAESAINSNPKDELMFTTGWDKAWISLRHSTVSAQAMEFLEISTCIQQYASILEKYMSLIGK